MRVDANMIGKVCVVLGLVCAVESSNYINDECHQDGVKGTCQLLLNCMSAFNNPKRTWWKYNHCGFVGEDPIVCCVPLPVATTSARPATTSPLPVATTSRPVITPLRATTTEYYPPEYDYEPNPVVINGIGTGTAEERASDDCPPLGDDMSPPKTGQKAYDKCIEYQQQLVYPCEWSPALMGGRARGSHCHHNVNKLIVGGVDAAALEFPHMVLLGYGRTNDSARWACGGTIISDRFILTAGHCTFSKGPVAYAIVGALRRSDDVQATQVYRIGRIFKHPHYRPPCKYHDIALLETTEPIALDETTVPACLDVFGGDRSHATATGWGLTQMMGNNADTLQKVRLTQFPERECRSKYRSDRHTTHYDTNTQMCYGDYFRAADTCQGDSGGPLTILNDRVNCMYTVVGVTSFGRGCGSIGLPGYYSRVSSYVAWIESIVWP